MTETHSYWLERTINGIRYQFEAEVDYLDRYRVNAHQQSYDGHWTKLHGAWEDGPRGQTHEEALVSFVDRFEFLAEGPTMTKRHETKTYRGRPACAGSGAVDPERSRYNYVCPVCGRRDIGRTSTRKLNTHLHAGDLA